MTVLRGANLALRGTPQRLVIEFIVFVAAAAALVASAHTALAVALAVVVGISSTLNDIWR